MITIIGLESKESFCGVDSGTSHSITKAFGLLLVLQQGFTANRCSLTLPVNLKVCCADQLQTNT